MMKQKWLVFAFAFIFLNLNTLVQAQDPDNETIRQLRKLNETLQHRLDVLEKTGR